MCGSFGSLVVDCSATNPLAPTILLPTLNTTTDGMQPHLYYLFSCSTLHHLAIVWVFYRATAP